MNTKRIAAGALSGLVLAGGLAGMVSAQSATAVTREQAIEIALAAVPGVVTEVERDREDGVPVFEVEIKRADGTEREVTVSAETGDVLEIEVEDDDDDRDHS